MKKSLVSLEDVLLETLPFADALLEWCKVHPKFKEALKVIYSNRFLHLGAVITSHPKIHSDDEVIGVVSYDYQLSKPIFKQDFIVNIDKKYKEFAFTLEIQKEVVSG